MILVAAAPVAVEPLVASLSVSLTATEKATIKRAAAAADMSMSAWARACLTSPATTLGAPQ